jgi:mRNA interferase RelE/StbE
MSRYTVIVNRSARKAIESMPREVQRRIVNRLDELEENPRPPDMKVLKGGDGEVRIRVGDYRILYTIEDCVLTVVVIKVGNRRDVYRKVR